ncbi:Uncharacterised protein [Mycobacterium tuberculosis]|nr:Uncharacterised protein [Mycobacterium tuberculosis]
MGQLFRVQHIGDPDPNTGDLVLVARPDTTAGGADLLAAHIALGDLVDSNVVRHQQMGVGGDQQLGGVHAAVLQSPQLIEQDTGIDHHAVADNVGDPGRQHTRRDEMQCEILAGRQDDGVPGVVAPLIAHHPLHAATQQVGGLTLALVAPLGADEDDRRHELLPPGLAGYARLLWSSR